MSESDTEGIERLPTKKEGKSDDVFEVEKILAHKVSDEALSLKVRWKGYNSDADTWEPEEDLRECANEAVTDYYRMMKVNDKTELIERLQKEIKKSKAAVAKKRERSPSDVDDAASDSDQGRPKPSKKNKVSRKSGLSSKNTKASTKALLKSHDTSSAGLVTPNNAKKAAMEVRDTRWDESDDESNDESNAPASDIDILRNKVKSKSGQEARESKERSVADLVPPKAVPNKEKSSTPQPGCSSSLKKKGTRDSSTVRQRSLELPVGRKEAEPLWATNGIVRHTDGSNTKSKLIMMTNSATGETKIMSPADAYKLDGWSLTKYLLDRCEF